MTDEQLAAIRYRVGRLVTYGPIDDWTAATTSLDNSTQQIPPSLRDALDLLAEVDRLRLEIVVLQKDALDFGV